MRRRFEPVWRRLTRPALVAACALVSACGLSDEALQPPPETPPAGAVGGAPATEGTLLLVIDWTDSPADYEPALAAAVDEARRWRPGAGFKLVALSPGVTEGAEPSLGRRAEAVLRSLADLGVAHEKVSLSVLRSADSGAGEMRLYLR
jgi:hypothetical protein